MKWKARNKEVETFDQQKIKERMSCGFSGKQSRIWKSIEPLVSSHYQEYSEKAQLEWDLKEGRKSMVFFLCGVQTGGRLDSGDCTGIGRTDGVVYFLLFSSRAGSASHGPFAEWA